MTNDVIVVIGAGGLGVSIARRQGFGKTILLADWSEDTLAKAAGDLTNANYTVATQRVDIASRESVRALADAAAQLGAVTKVVNAAGLSPNMASSDRILAVHLYGTAQPPCPGKPGRQPTLAGRAFMFATPFDTRQSSTRSTRRTC